MLQRRQFIQGAGLTALAPRSFGNAASAAPQAAGTYEWQSVPWGAGGFITGFLFHPKERGLLYVRTDIGGAYRFDPAAHAWVPLLDHLCEADADLMGVLSLAVDPHESDRLYAACGLYLDKRSRAGALLVSEDRGAHWQVHELGIQLGGNSPGRGSGERLQVDPNDGNVLLLGSSQDGLLKSTDRGRSFRALGLPARHVSFVLIDPGSGSPGSASRTIYAGSHDQPGLYVSHDGGASFERVAATPRQAAQQAALAADGTLYVTFAQGEAPVACNPSYARTGSVWKRDPDGRWTDITPDKPDGRLRFGYSGVDVDRAVPGRLIVSTIERHHVGDELFISQDGGAHWTPLSDRSQHDAQAHPWLVDYMRGERRMGHWTSAVKLDPFDGNRALYGTGYGVWLTGNLGAATRGDTVRWTFTVQNLEETATLEIRSPATGARLLAAMGDVAGGAWDDLRKTPEKRFFTPSRETNRSVDFAELDQRIIARTGDGRSSGYWSDDGGASWQPFASSPRVGKVQSGSVAVSAKGGAFVYVPQEGSALWSHDRGRSWAPCKGWPMAREARLRAVADRGADGVFYVHDRENGSVLVSRDGGRSFEPLLDGLPPLQERQWAHLVSAPGAEGDLWLALHDRLLHLPGRGLPVVTLKAVHQAWMLALGKGPPGAAYHSVYLWGKLKQGGAPVEGLFRSDDAGLSFTRLNDDRHRYGLLLSMAADPREHGTLYLAPHGRGVIVGGPRSRA